MPGLSVKAEAEGAAGARGAEKRERILRAAITVFARRGYHEAKVGEIAAEAGVAYGLVYHYFGSKEALLETIFRDAYQAFLGRLRAIVAEEAPALERLRWISAILLRTWTADPELMRVIVLEVGRSAKLSEEIREITLAFDALAEIIRQGQARGELRDDVDPQVAAAIAYGALDELLTAWVLGQLPGEPADVERAERAVEAILTGGLAKEGART